MSKPKRRDRKVRRYDTAPEHPPASNNVGPGIEVPDRRDVRKPRQIIQEDEVDASESQYSPHGSEGVNDDPVVVDEQITEISQHSHTSNPRYKNQTDNDNENDSPSPSEAEAVAGQSDQVTPERSSPNRDELVHSAMQHEVRNITPRSNDVSNVHQVSSRHGTPRVTRPKAKSKPSRRATEGNAVSNTALKNPLPEINDYMQIVWHKAKSLESYYAEKYTDELDGLEAERQQVLESKEALQKELHHANREKQTLATTVGQQTTKLAKLETQVKKFSNYMKGLGKDFDTLKQEAMAREQKREELSQEAAAHQADREALWQEMNLRTEAAATLRKETFAKLAESEQNLRDAGVQSKYLEKRLSDSVGMLAEERDRSSRLESQLGQQRSINGQSEEKMTELIKTSEQVVLDKLSEIYKAIRGDHETDGVSFLLMETLTAVQSMSTQSGTTATDAASAKAAVEKLTERFVVKHSIFDKLY